MTTPVIPDPYGYELALDLHGCNAAKFTRASISGFMWRLCDVISMTPHVLHFWDDVGVPFGERQTNPKTKGTSAIQFLMESSIVLHSLDQLGSVFVNIFSCKPFNPGEATEFTASWFEAKVTRAHELERSSC